MLMGLFPIRAAVLSVVRLSSMAIEKNAQEEAPNHGGVATVLARSVYRMLVGMGVPHISNTQCRAYAIHRFLECLRI